MNPLYEVVQDLKNRIAKGEISGYTALDLFYQHIGADQDNVPQSIPQEDHPDWIKNAIPPTPEPAPEPVSEEPVDGLPADIDTE